MNVLFEAAYHASHAPAWLGWSLLLGGAFGLGFATGRGK